MATSDRSAQVMCRLGSGWWLRTRTSAWLLIVWALVLVCGPARLRAQQPTAAELAAALEKVLVEAIAGAERSVVAIACVPKPQRDSQFDSGQTPQWNNSNSSDLVPQSYGTGVVIDRRGLIATNAHVLGKVGQFDYYVSLAGQSYPAQVKAVDPWMDLAVLQIEATSLQPIRFGNVSNLRKGQIVIALGNPQAIARDGQASASWGIIANLNRQAATRPTAVGAPARESLHDYGTYIQTDAKLNLGTSGGALINLQGEMIGMTTSRAAVEGYETSAGFAIPVNETFKAALEQLKEGRVPEYGFLGVQPVDLGDSERQRGRSGARVQMVFDGTPASKAGLQRDDVITQVQGSDVRDASHLVFQLSGYMAESRVQLTVMRPGNRSPRQLEVVMGKRYIDSRRPAYSQLPASQWRGMRVDYPTAIPPDQFLRLGGIDDQGCVVVTEVDRESTTWQAGLRPYAFITHVGKDRVSTPRQFYDAVRDLPGAVELRLADPNAPSSVLVVQP